MLETPWTCRHCGFKTRDLYEIGQHLFNHHKDAIKPLCPAFPQLKASGFTHRN